MARGLNFHREVDGIIYSCGYSPFRHGVQLTVSRGVKRVKRFISFDEVPIIGINKLIDAELYDMKWEVMKYPYEDVYPFW